MEQDWNARTTARIGKAVADARKRRAMTAQALADATVSAGYAIDRSVIAKIEKGLRQSISVAELVVIARALDVPPVLLLYPLGEQEEVEVLPERTAFTWAAFRWFVGEASFPGDLGVPHGEIDEATGLAEWYENPWREGAAPVALFRQHAERVADWYDLPARLRRLGLDEDEERRQRAREWARAEEAIRETRNTMRMRGLKPPRLSEDLAHLDR